MPRYLSPYNRVAPSSGVRATSNSDIAVLCSGPLTSVEAEAGKYMTSVVVEIKKVRKKCMVENWGNSDS